MPSYTKPEKRFLDSVATEALIRRIGALKKDIDDKLAAKAASTHDHDYTVNGKEVKSNPELTGADVELGTFELSDKLNEELMPEATDTVSVALGKAFKAILDNEDVTADALANLQTQIEGKASTSHTHTTTQVTGLDDKIGELETSIAGKANTSHTHTSANITDLSDLLDGKANATHTHAIDDVTGLQALLGTLATKEELKSGLSDLDLTIFRIVTVLPESDIKEDKIYLVPSTETEEQNVYNEFAYIDGKWEKMGSIATKIDLSGYLTKTEASNAYAPKSHTHTIAQVTGLQDELDAKAEAVHTHTTTQVTGLDDKIGELETSIAGKANTSHTHTIADVTGLQDELDGKAASDHNHDYTINGKAVSSNPELAGADVELGTFELSDKLNEELMPEATDTISVALGKAFKAILDNEDVTADALANLQTQIEGKANTSHTHTIADVTGLQDELDEKAASAALIALNKVLGVSGTNSAMPDLSGTQYLSGLTNFVDIAKKLDESIYKFTDGGTITQAANASATPEVPSANRTADYITLDYKYSATTTRTIPELVNLGFFADRNNKIQYLLITNTGNSSAVLNITPGTGYSCNFATLTINAGYAVELSVYKNTVIASDGFLKR